MIVIERMIQEIYPGKSEALEDLDKKYDAVEGPLGFPPKKRYWHISGRHTLNTLVLERQWPSLAAMEAAYESTDGNPELQALHAEGAAIIKSSRIELYTPA